MRSQHNQAVQAAGGSLDTPFEGWTGGVFAKSPGSGHLEPQHIELNVISPGWLNTYGVQLRGGRDIVASDSMQTLPIALVNESFVREHLRSPAPIGAVVQIFADQKGTVPIGSRTVVGIVNNTVHRAIRDAAPPTVYLALAQTERIHPLLAFYIGARANASPTLVTSGVRSSLTSIDPNLRVSFRHLTDDVRANLTHERLLATLATFLGGFALLLAGVGVYGLAVNSVAARRREFAIRMACGSSQGVAVRAALVPMSITLALGLLVGICFSIWAASFVGSLVYGLDPKSPWIIAGAVITLAATGIVASWVPAMQLSQIRLADVLKAN